MHPIQVTDDTFEALVLKSELPVVVDFWAEWCGPCTDIAPKLEALAAHYEGRLVIAKVDNDANTRYAETYKVEGIPHMLFFYKGELVGREVGNAPKEQLRIAFDEFLSCTGDTSVAFPSEEAEAAFKAAVADAEGKLDEAYAAAGKEFRSQPAFKDLSEASQPIREAALAELEPRRSEFADNNEFEREVSRTCRRLQSEDRFATESAKIKTALEAINANTEATDKMQAAIKAAEETFNASVASARTTHKG